MSDFAKSITYSFNASKAQTHIIRLLQAENYAKLQQSLASYGRSAVGIFFAEKGALILGWALAIMPTSQSLAILVEYVPPEVLKELLQAKDFEILRNFLMAEVGGDLGTVNSEERRKKFELLSKIDERGIKEFMAAYGQVLNCTPHIIADFKSANKKSDKSKEDKPLL